jgi:prephenate dehydratase
MRDIYKSVVIPLTKEVEVAYLLHRLDHPSIACVGDIGGSAYRAVLSSYGELVKPNIALKSTNGDVFAAVASNEACYGVVLLSHSRIGMMAEVRDLLHATSLKICDEIFMNATRSNNAFVKLTSDDKTVDATPCDIDGLPPLPSRNINGDCVSGDDEESQAFLRYVVLSKHNGVVTGHDKTTIVLGVRDKAGALKDALQVFHRHDVNLIQIESFPSLHPSPSHDILSNPHNFILELHGHCEDAKVSSALIALNEHTDFVHVIGSYPDGILKTMKST